VRRPRLDYESHAIGLDRNEVGAMLVAAGLAGARDHELISLLAFNGLRVSEAIGTDIGYLGLERGHRTPTILRKGGKVVTILLAPRTARPSIWRPANAAKDRSSWADGRRIDRHAAERTVHHTASPDGLDRQAGRAPHPWPRVHNRSTGRRRAAS
jgi:integrase